MIMNSFLNGFLYLGQGIGLLTRPGLRRYVILPLLINLVIFALLWWLGAHYFHEFTDWITSKLPHALQWLAYLFWGIFWIAALILTFYLFTLIANLIGAPFNSLLSEKVENLISTVSVPNTSWHDTLLRAPESIRRQLQIIFYCGSRALIFLILFFIPVIHIIASVLWFFYSAWITSLQYMDYPMDNHRISFRAMREMMQQKKGVVEGFGIATLIMTLIPIVNFFVMPAAVAGATILWVREFKQQR